MPQPHRTLKYFYLRFIRLKGDPRTLARGVAIGMFVGMTPTIPFQTVTSLFLAVLFRGSKIAALLASMLITTPLTYYLSWRIGTWLIPADLSWERIKTVKDMLLNNSTFLDGIEVMSRLGLESIVAMLLGGIILSAPIALVGYVIAFKFFLAVQKKRREKHILS